MGGAPLGPGHIGRRNGVAVTGAPAARPMIGVYDYSYAPYALGDTLTWLMNLEVGAASGACDVIDAYLVIDPARPSSRYQPFVNTLNYVAMLDGLFPAFLCSARLRSLKVIRDPRTFALLLAREAVRRRPMWPSLWSHLRRRLDFISHRRINAFYRRHGHVPRLEAPRGYGAWADRFCRDHAADRFVVSLNIRQSARSMTPANLYRDSPVEEWLAFVDTVSSRDPQTLFVLMGGYTEWDRRFLRCPNVVIPRVLGFGLGHELALLERSDLFMGTSSGFGTMATFCGVPYVITNIEHLFASYAGIEVGARHYPFAGEHQLLYWQTETRELLLQRYEELRPRLDRRR
jgi:hypothetical protein